MKIKHLFFTVILVLFTSTLLAQSKSPDFYAYYLNIYQAEKNICNQQLDSAILYYNKAFTNFNNEFYYDMYNAAICAEKSGDYKNLDKFLKLLCSYGYAIDFIETESLATLEKLNENEFKAICNQLKADFQKGVDKNLQKECEVRVENDIRANKKRINDGKPESLRISTNVIYENIEWLQHIIDSCGYPNRKLTGASYEPNNSCVGLLIVHFYQTKARKVFPYLSLLSWEYKEDSIINKYDSIPMLGILSEQVKVGNMPLGEHVNLHNWARSIDDGKYFYKYYYNLENHPYIFNKTQDSTLIKMSEELYFLISSFKAKNVNTKFILGKSLYKLETFL